MVNYIARESEIMSIKVNDKRIMDLKELVKEKKSILKDMKKSFTPVTNCSIEMDAARYNLQVLTKEQLTTLLIKLNMYKMSGTDLNVLDGYLISGFSIDSWIVDIKSKLEVISFREKENELLDLEKKLQTLLSTDKKVELEIDSIESMLK
jgi:hypothetical protein